jgi:hypothetical protein
MSDSLIMPLSKEELAKLQFAARRSLTGYELVLFSRLVYEVIQLRKRTFGPFPLKSRINWDGDTVQNIIQEVLDEVARHIRWTPPNPQQEATRFPTHKDVAEPACKNCGFTLDAHADGWCPNQIGGTRYRK